MEAKWDQGMIEPQVQVHPYRNFEDGRRNALGTRLDSCHSPGVPPPDRACYERQCSLSSRPEDSRNVLVGCVDPMLAWPRKGQQFARRDEDTPEHLEIGTRPVLVPWTSTPPFSLRLITLLLFSNFIGKAAAEEILDLNRNIVSDTLSHFGDLVGPAAVVATFLFGAAILFIIAFCVRAKKGPPTMMAVVAGVASASWLIMEVFDKEDESPKVVAGWVCALLWAVLLSLCGKGLDDSDYFMFETLCSGGLTFVGIIFVFVAVKVLEDKPLDHSQLRTVVSCELPPLNLWTWFQFKRHLSRETWNQKHSSLSRNDQAPGNAYATSSEVEAQSAHGRIRLLAIEGGPQRGR